MSNVEWTDTVCEACGKPFPHRKDNKRFCSRACYDARDGILGERERSRQRIRWIQRTWYGDNVGLFTAIEGKRRGREFEALAATRVLPDLGFSSIVDLAEIAQGSPVDFIASRQGARVLIDVTTKWQKSVELKARYAAAFQMPLFVLAISPHNSAYYALMPVAPTAKAVRVPIAMLRSIAAAMEIDSGR